MSEGEWHKKVRKKLIKKYEKEGFKIESSHEDKTIVLSLGEAHRDTFLSDADLVVFKNNKIKKIIEIQDEKIRPKDIIGIIKATDLCDRCKIDKNKYSLSDVELIIYYPKQEKKSKKSEQFQLIKDNLKVDGCIGVFNFEEDY